MSKKFYISLFCLAGLAAAGWVFSSGWYQDEKASRDLVEDIPEYNSHINWTTGKIRTTVSVPYESGGPNVGRNLNSFYSAIRDELRQNLIKAMGYLRISDIFLLKDYYAMKNEVRFEIVANSDRAYYFPPTLAGGMFTGMVELDLFGKNGLANIFYRDVEKVTLTNYVQTETKNMEYFDGLILDTIVYDNYRPSVQMRVYDQEGVLLYGPETVDKGVLEKYGVCEYTTSLLYAFNSPRSGGKIYYLIPYGIRGKMNTDLIIHNKDAARIFANPRTIRFINQSRVVVVVQPKKGT